MLNTILIVMTLNALLFTASLKAYETAPKLSWKLFQALMVVTVIGAGVLIGQGVVELVLLVVD